MACMNTNTIPTRGFIAELIARLLWRPYTKVAR